MKPPTVSTIKKSDQPLNGFFARFRRSIFFDASVISFGYGLSQLAGLGFRYLSLRILTLDDYGKLALAISWVNVILPFASFNIGNALAVAMNDQGEADPEAARGNWLGAGLLSIFALSIILIPAVLSNSYIRSQSQWMIPIVFINILSTGLMSFSEGYFRGLGKLVSSSLIISSYNLGEIALLGIGLSFGLVNPQIPILAYLLGTFLSPILGLILLARNSLFWILLKRATWKGTLSTIRLLFQFSVYIVLGNSLTWALQYISRSMLLQQGFKLVGVFDAAMLLYNIPRFAFTGIGLALVPRAARTHATIKIPMNRILLLYIPLVLIMPVMAFTPLASHMLELVGLKEYIPSLPILWVQLFVAPVELIFVVGYSILFGQKKTRDYFLSILIILPFHALFTWIGSRLWSGMGVAAATILTFGALAYLVKIRVEKSNKI